jgi:hypothetical protein
MSFWLPMGVMIGVILLVGVAAGMIARPRR